MSTRTRCAGRLHPKIAPPDSASITHCTFGMDVSEKNFEQTIEAALVVDAPRVLPGGASPGVEASPFYGEFAPGGYQPRQPEDYEREVYLIPEDVHDFIYATQPKEWEKFTKQQGAEAKDRLFKRLASETKLVARY